MQEKKPENIDDILLEKIINTAYGDASIFVRIEVLWKASKNKKVKAILDEYKETAGAVHNINKNDLPDHVIENVKNETDQFTLRGKTSSKLSLLYTAYTNKKLIPVAALGMLLISIVSFLIFKEPVQHSKYTKADIELAQKQAIESLEIVAKVLQNTELKLDYEISDKVSKQLNKGLSVVNDYVTGG